MTLSSSSLRVEYDFVLFEKGSEIEELTLGDVGSPDTDSLKSICDTALAKMP